ncbi:hypothetical protein [Streptomyces sp. NPDC058755]|uniref:hypothetical protein n=1 Tax=Streptomyces sp. NPDC058755 TaxID=3346624 RepID=UPI0036CFC50E
MKRGLPVLALTVAGLIPLWRCEHSHGTTATEAPATTAIPQTSASGRVVAGPTVTTEKGDVQVDVTLDGDRISSVRMLKQPDNPQTKAPYRSRSR